MDNNTPQQNVETSSPTGDLNQLPSLQTQPDPQLPKSNRSRKKVLIFLVLILVVAVGLTAALMLTKSSPKPSSNTSPAKAAVGLSLKSSEEPGSKNNHNNHNLAFGFVRYEVSKLEPITTDESEIKGLEPIGQVVSEPNSALSPVAFVQTYHVPYDTSMLMYDFKTKKTYDVIKNTDQLVRHYYNPMILSDHYVAFYELTYKDPITLIGSVVIVDLLTGQKQTVLEDKAGNFPANLCCAVSPNGLYLAVPKPPNKIAFFSAGGDTVNELEVSTSFLPKTQEGTGDKKILGSSDYAQSQLSFASKYPVPEWLDNDHLILANRPPESFVGASSSESVNGLSILTISTGKLMPITSTDNFAISWFGVTNNTIILAAKKAESSVNAKLSEITNLYKVDLSSSKQDASQLSKDSGATGAGGPYVIDKTKDNLYAQEGNNLFVYSIKDGSIKDFNIPASSEDLVGIMDENNVIIGTTDALASNPILKIYNLVTDKTFQIL